MSNKLTAVQLQKAKDMLGRLEHANLTPWETSFIESVTEQTDADWPWMTARQQEILEKLDGEKG